MEGEGGRYMEAEEVSHAGPTVIETETNFSFLQIVCLEFLISWSKQRKPR